MSTADAMAAQDQRTFISGRGWVADPTSPWWRKPGEKPKRLREAVETELRADVGTQKEEKPGVTDNAGKVVEAVHGLPVSTPSPVVTADAAEAEWREDVLLALHGIRKSIEKLVRAANADWAERI